jgi:hypothetical protein
MWVLFSVAVAGPANVNDGLVRWYRADLGVIGSTMVDQWNDQAGGSDARKSGNATRARRQLSAVLNQEILWFDGSDSLLFDGSPLVNSDYTVFVVAGRAGAGSEAYYLGGDSTLNDANFVAGYRDSTTLRVSHYGNPLSATVPAWTSGEDWHLQAYTLSSTGRTLHSDGPLVASDSDNGRLTGWNDARIGSYKANNKFFVGAMAEIVMYDRALDCSERNAVAEELSARWGVPWNSLDDADGDGACAPADCNDANPNVRPGAPEACNGVDDDCVGGAAGEGDGDGDGMRVCEGDCVDTDPSIPRAEQCNGIDDDCVAGVPVDERDLDGDGFRTCTGDCADTNNARYPGAVEVPGNGVDENCDGSDAAVCYDDDDDDGFGDTTVAGPVGCGSAGMAALNGDCDDLDDGLYPGAADRPDDGVDQDCSGADTVTCWADMDGDLFGAGVAAEEPSGVCAPGLLVSGVGTDCDDLDQDTFPGSQDVPGDGVDQDCSGRDAATCWTDADGDGYGSPGAFVTVDTEGRCPAGSVADATDCNDGARSVHPDAPDAPDDGVDQDCDGEDPSEVPAHSGLAGHTGHSGLTEPEPTDTGAPEPTGPCAEPPCGGGDTLPPPSPCGCATPAPGGALLPLLLLTLRRRKG